MKGDFLVALWVVVGLAGAGRVAAQEPEGPVDCCPARLAVFIQSENVGQVEENFAANVADCTPPEDGSNLVHEVSGESVHLYVGLNSSAANGLPSGAQAWSLSIAVTGDITVTRATTRGTVGDDSPPGLRRNGFEITELIAAVLDADPPRPAGVGSGVILSFNLSATLDVTGTATVLDLTLEPNSEPTEENPVVGTIFFRDGLMRRGGDFPVPNLATFAGVPINYCKPPRVDVTFIKAGGADFRRGDTNADGTGNLSDAVFVLNYLFTGGPAPSCLKSADPDDTGVLNLTDPVYLLNYFFLGGRQPSEPFAECGGDLSADGLSCNAHRPCR